jgi:lipoprotein-releasing system permease protein
MAGSARQIRLVRRGTAQAQTATGKGLLRQMAARMLLQGANGFARFVTWVSLLGLVLGVGVLTLVVNVMNGFDHELRKRLLGSISHIAIHQPTLSEPMQQVLAERADVRSVAKYFQGFGMVGGSGRPQPVNIIGFAGDDLAQMTDLTDAMQQGSLSHLENLADAIVIGEPLARYLGLSLGDAVMIALTVSQGDSVAFRWLRLNLVGTFELQAEPDYNMVLVNLDHRDDVAWQALGQLGTRVMLADPMQASRVGTILTSQDASADLETWEEVYGELFQAVRMEKSMMFMLLLLVVAIAGFNIVAGQSMMVHDKRAQIAMLRTLGADRQFVLSLFLSQGALIALVGTLGGMGLGLLLTVYVNGLVDIVGAISGQHLLDGSYFALVPTKLVGTDLAIIAGISALIALLAAWMPARRASQLNPAQFLH